MDIPNRTLEHYEKTKKAWCRKLKAATSAKETRPAQMAADNKRAKDDGDVEPYGDADVTKATRENDRRIQHLLDSEPTMQQSIEYIESLRDSRNEE